MYREQDDKKIVTKVEHERQRTGEALAPKN